MARNYLNTAASAVATPPQSEPLDSRQVANSAGGYAYPVDNWTRMDRFLVLGSEGGSYYASEQKLTVSNVKAIAECVREDGLRAVARIVEISDSGRAPKNDPALLALAYAAGRGDEATRAAALDALPKVARIGTHLFHFASYVENFRGWGRGLRTAVANWYGNQTVEHLAAEVTKYQQRDGWSHKDLLRLSKPGTKDRTKWTAEHSAIANWVVGKGYIGCPARIQGHVALQVCTQAKEAAELIRKYGLVRESVPTELLTKVEVWEALFEKMPMTAMIRNLGNLSKCGLLAPMSETAKTVCARLADRNALQKARVHPISLLIAQKTYAAGRGMRGSGVWPVVPQVVDALDEAFYLAFQLVEPTGKRYYLGLDVSGSMSSGQVAGVPLTPREASSAMAMVTARSEASYYIAAFQERLVPLSISPRERLDDICQRTHGLPFGGTDCAQPMLDAMAKKLAVDVFIIYTDSETWFGDIHPVQALRQYRQKMGIPAKLAVLGLVANEFSIADENDKNMMDFVGFDTAVPTLLADFAKE